MDKAAILARLQEHEPALRERGVTHAAIFGSRARGDNRPDSDIDILVEIGPMSLWGYVGLTQFIEGLFPRACRRCGPKPPETLRPTDRRARSDLCVLARVTPPFSISATTRLSRGTS
jgi:predicted nucleotidyltransferase